MLSRIQLGVLARDYLCLRAREVPHFEKNAQYIKPFFVESQRVFWRGELLEIEIDGFCEDLASILFKQSQRSHTDLISEDAFLCMCYVLVKYILYKRGICVGEALKEEARIVAEACKHPPELVLLFFRVLTEEIWGALE